MTFCCLCRLRLFRLRIVRTVSVIVMTCRVMSFSSLSCSRSVKSLDTVASVKARVTCTFFFSINSPNMFIDESPVVLESKLCIITNWRLDDIFAFNLLLGIAKVSKVWIFKNF